jgi:UDP-galactopyranose mutase
MTNKQILEDYKIRIQHPGFAVFYCKELDRNIIRRLPVKDEEKQHVLSEFEKNGLPPEGYSISVKAAGAVVKRQISKKSELDKETDTVIVRADIPVKKCKKVFDDVL